MNMMRRASFILSGVIIVATFIGASVKTRAYTAEPPLVRIAELEITSGLLAPYKDALKEEITTSIREEPGVLTLYAVSVKGQPSQIRIFETYKDQAAYESHLQTPHFKKYKAATQGMVKSLKLIETEPILLGQK